MVWNVDVAIKLVIEPEVIQHTIQPAKTPTRTYVQRKCYILQIKRDFTINPIFIDSIFLFCPSGINPKAIRTGTIQILQIKGFPTRPSSPIKKRLNPNQIIDLWMDLIAFQQVQRGEMVTKI